MKSQVYQNILHENLRPSVCKLKLNRGFVRQQDDDLKHGRKLKRMASPGENTAFGVARSEAPT